MAPLCLLWHFVLIKVFMCRNSALVCHARHISGQLLNYKNQPIVVFKTGLTPGSVLPSDGRAAAMFLPIPVCGGSFLYSVGRVGGQGALANPCPVLWRCRSTAIAAVYQLLFFPPHHQFGSPSGSQTSWLMEELARWPQNFGPLSFTCVGKRNENEAKQPICLDKVTQETKHGKRWRLKVTREWSNLKYDRSI